MKMKFETYLATWSRDCLDALHASPITENTVINLAFASFIFDDHDNINGLSKLTDDQVNSIISYLRSKGAKVKLAFGGGTQPYFLSNSNLWDDVDNIAKAITRILIKYDFDGCDLDIEERNNSSDFEKKVCSIIESIRRLNPKILLTLTVPGQGWDSYWQNVSIESYQYLDYINFMEYYIALQDKRTFEEQIKKDINDYITKWNIPPNKVCLGLMPGKSSTTNDNDLTLGIADTISSWASSKSIAGVMIWDLNRDYAGMDQQLSFAYTKVILTNIK